MCCNDEDVIRVLFRRGSATFAGLVLVAIVGLAACSPAVAPSPSAPITSLSSTAAASPASPNPSPTATLATGFAFDAESVVGYYRTQGYACSEPQPSALADGFLFTSCELVGADRRTRVIGVVTDTADELTDGFASVEGHAGESILEPSVAIEPLGGFLGAMLGPERGEALLTWLAGHLGDAYAETTIGDLRVATYIKGQDHSTLYVELALPSYLEAPRPSPSG